MSEPTKPTGTGKLDLCHKLVFPFATILIAGFVAYQHWGNNERQKQITTLQAEMKQMRDRQNQSDGQAHKLRVDLVRRSLAHMNYSNSPEEGQASFWIKSNFAIACSIQECEEAKHLGEKKARELWQNAREEAKKDVTGGNLNWSLVP